MDATGRVRPARVRPADLAVRHELQGRRPWAPDRPYRRFPGSTRRTSTVARYTLVYRDDDGENQVTETLDNVDDVQREDGIVSFWRGDDAFLRVQERHVVSLDEA
jgi:hypothetical protein